jgi:hypothetical protein
MDHSADCRPRAATTGNRLINPDGVKGKQMTIDEKHSQIAAMRTGVLMSDVTGRTRSWFMAAPVPDEASDRTLLYFGSAITAARKGTAGRMTIGPVFKALTGFHILYSRALLAAAEKRIERLNDQVKP